MLLDLDGTLVDSVFWHVVCWAEALREHGRNVPQWRVHAGIGMGGDRLLPWLLGDDPDDAGAIEESHRERFLAGAERLQPTPGAAGLLDDLARRDVPHVVATSAGREERRALLDVLGDPDVDVADSSGVGSSKPDPELLETAADQLPGSPRLTVVGDSPWDAVAAARLGVRMVAVRCGGFGDAALREAGAAGVVDDPRALIGRL